MDAKIIVVDRDDEIINYKERGTLNPEDIYRVSALWITSREGSILLAKRSLNKELFPGCWGPAVSGTVEQEETYHSNIIKEAKEELGLLKIRPKKGPKVRITSDEYNYFTQWFLLTLDKELGRLDINREEISRLRWFGRKELKRKVYKDPKEFTHAMKKWIDIFC